MSGLKKGVLVVVGALFFSVLGIQASDTLRGLDTKMTGLVSDAGGVCGVGAVQMLFGSHALCVDIYEASPSSDCPVLSPTNQNDTQTNMNDFDCFADSQPNAYPWRFVSLTQAQQLCARTGKRLPSNDEWYRIASGMGDQSSCVVDTAGAPQPTGSAGCVTPAGVHDVIGNVWEWVDAEVVDGTYNERPLPESGYVAMVDSDGVVVETAGGAQDEYGHDYAWTKTPGVYGVVRGGFYGSESDAGIFAQNLATPLDSKTAGIGMRCVRDI